MTPHATRRALLAGLALAGAGMGGATAGPPSTRPLRIIVPQAPGGASDALVRLLADGLAPTLGRTVLVDNRPGGGTVKGTLGIATAPPDGDTIGLIIAAHAINQALRRAMPYHALADFEPVCLGGHTVMALVAHASLPADDVAQLLALARRSPLALHYASLGVGTASHLAGELLGAQAAVPLRHVPYNGSPPIYHAMRGGDIRLAFVTLESALPHVQAGMLKVLGVTAARRNAAHPRFAAIAEAVPGYEVLSFFGFVAPANTPADSIAPLYEQIAGVLGAPAVSSRLATLGVLVDVLPPGQFGAFLRNQIEMYAALARRTRITIE